jgi:hypothetical protein
MPILGSKDPGLCLAAAKERLSEYLASRNLAQRKEEWYLSGPEKLKL